MIAHAAMDVLGMSISGIQLLAVCWQVLVGRRARTCMRTCVSTHCYLFGAVRVGVVACGFAAFL
jgi:hypothetical protein